MNNFIYRSRYIDGEFLGFFQKYLYYFQKDRFIIDIKYFIHSVHRKADRYGL